MAAELSLDELDALVAFVQDERVRRVKEAREKLRLSLVEQAGALGLTVEEVLGIPPARGPGRPPLPDPMPADAEDRIVACLRENNGRAYARMLYYAVYPKRLGGPDTVGVRNIQSVRLRKRINQMVEAGKLLVLVASTGTGVQTLYGLPGMVEPTRPTKTKTRAN